MHFETYGDVILARDARDRGRRAGDVDTVVDRHTAPGVAEEGYSVEFFDMTGITVTVVLLEASAPCSDASRSAGCTGPPRLSDRRLRLPVEANPPPATTRSAGSNSRKCGSPAPTSLRP